jgi:hypothetical protein
MQHWLLAAGCWRCRLPLTLLPCHLLPCHRDYFLIPDNYASCKSLLVQRFGELMRKIWNPRNFKGQVGQRCTVHACMMQLRLLWVPHNSPPPLHLHAWALAEPSACCVDVAVSNTQHSAAQHTIHVSCLPPTLMQVSPHEFMQAVMVASSKHFTIDTQSDPVDFWQWLLNTLHMDLTGNKPKKSSIITRCFQVGRGQIARARLRAAVSLKPQAADHS